MQTSRVTQMKLPIRPAVVLAAIVVLLATGALLVYRSHVHKLRQYESARQEHIRLCRSELFIYSERAELQLYSNSGLDAELERLRSAIVDLEQDLVGPSPKLSSCQCGNSWLAVMWLQSTASVDEVNIRVVGASTEDTVYTIPLAGAAKKYLVTKSPVHCLEFYFDDAKSLLTKCAEPLLRDLARDECEAEIRLVSRYGNTDWQRLFSATSRRHSLYHAMRSEGRHYYVDAQGRRVEASIKWFLDIPPDALPATERQIKELEGAINLWASYRAVEWLEGKEIPDCYEVTVWEGRRGELAGTIAPSITNWQLKKREQQEQDHPQL